MTRPGFYITFISLVVVVWFRHSISIVDRNWNLTELFLHYYTYVTGERPTQALHCQACTQRVRRVPGVGISPLPLQMCCPD